ncbi:MAG: 30S ribosomal protein S1 [Ruminococcaceae bacterium]|nr:30S ribosomal protein S1 [Oscillospiraceae bacterium]
MNHQNTESGVFESYYLPEGQLLHHPRNRDLISTLQGLERAMNMGIILEGVAVLCDQHMNLHVDLPSLPEVVAMIPPEEAVYSAERAPVKDIAILTRVGKAVCFKVIGMARHEGRVEVTLSRRLAQADCIAHYLSTLIPGDIVSAKITHMESFGAFADIGCGVSSLLSVDSISVSRIAHPRARLCNGQLIKAVIKRIDRLPEGLPGRIFLSTRELLGTWEENAAKFSAGQTVAGVIRSVEEYGVFVELTPNLAGLAELKEDSGNSLKAAIREQIGHRATVYIKSILPERMKIKLVLIDTYPSDTALPVPLSFHLPEDGRMHMDKWRYSPVGAARLIESRFSASPENSSIRQI